MFQVLASMVLGTKNAYPIIKLGLLVRALRPHCPVLQATLGARYSPRGNEVGEDYLFCSFTKKINALSLCVLLRWGKVAR